VRRRAGGLVALAAMVAAACGGRPVGTGSIRHDDHARAVGFPLAVGTTWIYEEERVRFDPEAADEERRERGRLEARVVAARTAGGITGAELSALPGVEGPALVVERGGAVWIRSLDPAARAAIAGDGDLAALVPAEPPLLRFPPAPGDPACLEPDGEPPFYCWVTEPSPAPGRLGQVRGLPAGHGREHARILRTRPDDTTWLFAAGLGVTGYAYHHHGTPDDHVARLVEIRLR
jgi:hypothetical protein